MKKVILVAVILLLLACNKKTKDFTNTEWAYDYGNGYVSHYIFKNCNYEYYNAESGDTFYGTYYVKGDTLFMNQTHGMYDEEFPEGSVHRTKKTEYQLLLINNNELGNLDQWNERNHSWIDDYYFVEIKK